MWDVLLVPVWHWCGSIQRIFCLCEVFLRRWSDRSVLISQRINSSALLPQLQFMASDGQISNWNHHQSWIFSFTELLLVFITNDPETLLISWLVYWSADGQVRQVREEESAAFPAEGGRGRRSIQDYRSILKPSSSLDSSTCCRIRRLQIPEGSGPGSPRRPATQNNLSNVRKHRDTVTCSGTNWDFLQ